MAVNVRRILKEFLDSRGEYIVNETARRVRESGGEHYRGMDIAELRLRQTELFEAYKQSVINHDRKSIESFISDVGLKRLREGYDLRELQSVITTMDKAIRVAATNDFFVYGAEAFEAFNRLNDTAGWARDRLAITCLEEVVATEARLRRLDDLFNDYMIKRRAV